MLKQNQRAPQFRAYDQRKRLVSLSQFKGKYVVVYFYPRDDTPGCTVEACNFRDENAALKAAGAVVLGVSPDDAASHRKFRSKFELRFTLLSDPDHTITKKYGAWGKKMNYGKSYMGVLRTTFVIGPNGKFVRIWRKVTPEGHATEVLNAISAHQKSQKPTLRRSAATSRAKAVRRATA